MASLTETEIRAALPSWRPGDTLDRLVDFLVEVTSGPGAVPPARRIASTDFDGTLAVEKPLNPVQAFVSYLRGGAAPNPDADGPAEKHDPAKETAGWTVDRYADAARTFLANARHPTLGAPWTKVVYVPMLELLALLVRLDFAVYVVTGSSRDFMRVYDEDVLGLPLEHVIGTEVQITYVDGRLVRGDSIGAIDEGAGKPAKLWDRAGGLPLLAAGNTAHDIEMLSCARHSLLVVHDDAVREFAYTDAAALTAAEEQGWNLVSMRDDFATVFPPPPDPTRN